MIFITGANGWLGLNLVESISSGEAEKWGQKKKKIRALVLPKTDKKKILKIDSNIEIIEGDLLNNEDISSFLDGCEDGILFHTAGIIHPKKVKDFDKVNNVATLKLLHKAAEKKIEKSCCYIIKLPLRL